MKKGEKKYTEDEKKLWTKYFTKFFQQLNKTGRSKLSPPLYEMFDAYYKEYLHMQDMKKMIIKELKK